MLSFTLRLHKDSPVFVESETRQIGERRVEIGKK